MVRWLEDIVKNASDNIQGWILETIFSVIDYILCDIVFLQLCLSLAWDFPLGLVFFCKMWRYIWVGISFHWRSAVITKLWTVELYLSLQIANLANSIYRAMLELSSSHPATSSSPPTYEEATDPSFAQKMLAKTPWPGFHPSKYVIVLYFFRNNTEYIFKIITSYFFTNNNCQAQPKAKPKLGWDSLNLI